MISGYQISSRSPAKAAGTRTYIVRFRRPVAFSVSDTTRSAPAYSGTNTRSCRTAAPTNQSATLNQSPWSSRTAA
ncbi:hypothetical protein B0675_09860 [Streptomyces sp. M41(2017)]|nr:hypothetical protein B0675_09860 [Streptomyces sp. M41(2017)]